MLTGLKRPPSKRLRLQKKHTIQFMTRIMRKWNRSAWSPAGLQAKRMAISGGPDTLWNTCKLCALLCVRYARLIGLISFGVCVCVSVCLVSEQSRNWKNLPLSLFSRSHSAPVCMRITSVARMDEYCIKAMFRPRHRKIRLKSSKLSDCAGEIFYLSCCTTKWLRRS